MNRRADSWINKGRSPNINPHSVQEGIPMSDYREKNWRLETLPHDITPNPAPHRDEKADVVIIGGGYTGLSTGHHLKMAEPAMDVRVLESDISGYGASGRNGGFSMTLFGLTKVGELRIHPPVGRTSLGDSECGPGHRVSRRRPAGGFFHGVHRPRRIHDHHERPHHCRASHGP